MPLSEAHRILDIWISHRLKNVRFSGVEPTLYKGLLELVEKCKAADVEHIAVSSNGSADWAVYNQLLNAGVNDFSISLDSGCCSIGDDMAVAGEYHFPCIIYMREGGDPIGKIGFDVREQRKRWADKHDTHADRICREMCLDVCVAFNNVAASIRRSEV